MSVLEKTHDAHASIEGANTAETSSSCGFCIGFCDGFDGDDVRAYPPGSVIVPPGATWSIQWGKWGEHARQVTTIGVCGVEYCNSRGFEFTESSIVNMASSGVSSNARGNRWPVRWRYEARTFDAYLYLLKRSVS